jgi:hypothetical protein
MYYVDYLIHLSNGISLDYYSKSLKPAHFSAAYISQDHFSFPHGTKERTEKVENVLRNSNQVFAAVTRF